jgi:hypothetical protein
VVLFEVYYFVQAFRQSYCFVGIFVKSAVIFLALRPHYVGHLFGVIPRFWNDKAVCTVVLLLYSISRLLLRYPALIFVVSLSQSGF